jgi:hypothetical protein
MAAFLARGGGLCISGFAARETGARTAARLGEASSMQNAIHMALALAIGLAGAVNAQEVKHFKTWIAACDNLRSCAAYGFSDDSADDLGYLKLTRAGGPNATPRVVLQALDLNGDDKPALKWRILVDGSAPPGLAGLNTRTDDTGPRVELSTDQSRTLIAALRNGAALTLAGGKTPVTISLSGAAASLLWIDDRQGRVGTVAALAARGPRLAASVAPAPISPTVRAAALVSQARLPTKLPAGFDSRPDMSDCDTGNDHPAPFVVRLGSGQMLWAAACSQGAYNIIYKIFIADEAGRNARTSRLPAAIPSASNDETEVMNLNYRAKTGMLSSFAKARGLGDCGEQTSWVWDGHAFRLVDDSVMPDCHGVTADDWPSVFHATVSR